MKILKSIVAAFVISSLALPAAIARPDSAPLKGEGEGLKLIANIAYQGGTDMEFLTVKGRDYAFAGAAPGVGGAQTGALRVIDITTPEKPKLVATLPCGLYQSDIQISHDGKTLLMGADSAGGPDSCLMVGLTGFMTVDISNPKKPKAIGVAQIARGSHNVTAHPTKPYVYNSDSDQANRGNIEIWSIEDPSKPEKVKDFAVYSHSPHDISFNSDGTRAVTAARTAVHILDTTDPENPVLVGATVCPGCYLAHDAKFTPDGTHIIVGDEAAGGGAYPCPGGALYFYELQNGTVPVLTGTYHPEDLVFARDGQSAPGACTSHVFNISPDGKELAISWYTAGTRHLDISQMTGVTVGSERVHEGVTELGWFEPEGGISWSSKFFKGGYIYSNDTTRGFDVFKVTSK
jgi:hypothetical protein